MSKEVVHQKNLWTQIWENRAPYLFILPFYVLFAVFMVFPFSYSFWLSLHRWTGFGPAKYVGVDNYVSLFHDKLFWRALYNNMSMVFMTVIPGDIILALVMAIILNSKLTRGRNTFRVVYFTPLLTSQVATGLIFLTLYGAQYGILNGLLEIIGVKESIPWLTDSAWMKISLAILLIWRWLGYNIVIDLAGLQSIDVTLYDAAKIDGANATQRFLYITTPLMKPVLFFVMINSTIGTMQLFAEPLMITIGTLGGEANSLLTLVVYLYTRAFSFYHFGYAAAMSYVILLLCMSTTMILLRFLKD